MQNTVDCIWQRAHQLKNLINLLAVVVAQAFYQCGPDLAFSVQHSVNLFLLGLGIYLPISRYWRNFIFCTYQTGRMELTFGETRKYLSTDFFFNNGEDVFVISSPPLIELTTVVLDNSVAKLKNIHN